MSRYRIVVVLCHGPVLPFPVYQTASHQHWEKDNLAHAAVHLGLLISSGKWRTRSICMYNYSVLIRTVYDCAGAFENNLTTKELTAIYSIIRS